MRFLRFTLSLSFFVTPFMAATIATTAIAQETPSAAEIEPQKAVLITGASSGLGAKMTELLRTNGFFVYATARKEADLERLDKLNNVEAIKLDVLEPEQIKAAVKQVEKAGRGLYGLINNAGVAIFGPMTEVPVAELEYQMDVNVFGPYRVLQAFAPMIIESKGRIATTGSIAGTLTSPLFAHYAMSKHAIEAFTDGLAAEMQNFGVEVAVIAPGSYASNIGKTARNRILDNDYWTEDSAFAEQREGFLERLGQVDQGADPLPVAEAALDFMSSDSPKRRYMVVPNIGQANATIRKSMSKLIEQNSTQQFRFSDDELRAMFEEELKAVKSGN